MKPTCTAYTKKHENVHEVPSDHLKANYFQMKRFFFITIIALTIIPFTSFSQSGDGSYRPFNTLPTAAPFLLISPDAKTGGMGEACVANTPDVGSIYANGAKLAFMEKESGIGVSYNPWMQNLASDISLTYITAFTRLSDRTTLAGSFRYFSLGNAPLLDINRNSLGEYNPKEFALDATYSTSFGGNFSLGLAGRYIYSNLASGLVVGGQNIKAGNAFATDISMYYRNKAPIFGENALFAMGANISNIGTKISYVDNGREYFLPTNLKLGCALTLIPAEYNVITFALDLNKLLTPTEPVYSDANYTTIKKGLDPNRTVPSALFSSFYDAPNGLKEELQEISYSSGVEYWYADLFGLRTGYVYQNPAKGNAEALTMGAGVRYSEFGIDFAYLMPMRQTSPFSNTIRFTVLFNIEKQEKTK